MTHLAKKGKGFCHPFKMANQITCRSSFSSSGTVAIAGNRLPRNRCLPFALPQAGTLKDLSLLSRLRVYTGGLCKIGVPRSFERNDARRRGFSNRACGMARSCYYSEKKINSVSRLSERNYSSWLKKLFSCCLKPAADVTADQTGEISALQAMTRQVEKIDDITSGLAEEITSQQITHAGEASTSQTLPIACPKLSLFHSIMQREITGQQKDSFLIAELAERFRFPDPRFVMCREYIKIIGLRDRCEKGLLPEEAEFKFMSYWPSLAWYDWLSRKLQEHRMRIKYERTYQLSGAGDEEFRLSRAQYEEINFCFKSIARIHRDSLFSCQFLHPLLECLVQESSKRAFSFEPTEAFSVLQEILSPAQKRHHALKFSDLLNELAYWEKKVIAAVLHLPAVRLAEVTEAEYDSNLQRKLRGIFSGKVRKKIHTLMSESEGQETLGQETVGLLGSPFEPMTLEGIMFVIGGFIILLLAVTLFLFLSWQWLKLKPIRIPITLFKLVLRRSWRIPIACVFAAVYFIKGNLNRSQLRSEEKTKEKLVYGMIHTEKKGNDRPKLTRPHLRPARFIRHLDSRIETLVREYSLEENTEKRELILRRFLW